MTRAAKKLFFIALISYFLLTPAHFIQAACNWSSTGCANQQTTELDAKCSSSEKPGNRYWCCCDKEIEGNTATSDCLWTASQCPSNYSVTTNISSCTSNRPSVRHSCCCKDVVVAEQKITANPPDFIIPELQVNIGARFSQPICEPADSGAYVCSINWLGEYLSAIYDYALKIGGLLAAVMLMAGGVLWLISAGDASRISKAKSIITGSTLGLVLLFSTYIILTQINPELVKLNPISMGSVSSRQMTNIIKDKTSGAAATYAQMGCARDEELVNGIDFYATGYCKPAWEDSDKFRCFIAMNCSCPNGQNSSKNCDEWFGKTYPGYRPCNPFPADADYCGRTASGAEPAIGTIAAPDCENLRFGTQVCFNGKTYTVTDRGGGIQGRRIDIWTGSDCGGASQVTGVGRLTLGPCSN